MNLLSRFYGEEYFMISSRDTEKDKKEKTQHREAKFNFTKKANSNYKKALFIEEYHKSKVLQK
tara:strand:- start:188 stop:376 length:189 start_codon:yes stop_codon:yes gene_type:complete